MKFSLSWLKQHLDTDAHPKTVAETLTRIGLEVEGVDNPAEALAPFKVARVLTAHELLADDTCRCGWGVGMPREAFGVRLTPYSLWHAEHVAQQLVSLGVLG